MSEGSQLIKLHEILRELVEDLTPCFKKPGVFSKYVTQFWKLKIIADDTKDALMDTTKGASEDEKANKLHTTLYNTAKANSHRSDWQLSLITFLIQALEKQEEMAVAEKLREEIKKKNLMNKELAHILSPSRSRVPVPESQADHGPVSCKSAPTPVYIGDEENTHQGYEVRDTPESHNQMSAMQVINNGSKSKILPLMVSGTSMVPQVKDIAASAPTISDLVNLPYNSTANNKMVSRKRLANSTSEEIVMLLRRSSGVEIDFSAELRRLLMESDAEILKSLKQLQEKENERIKVDYEREENMRRILQMKQESNDSTIKKFQEVSKEENLKIMHNLSELEKAINENNKLLVKQEEKMVKILEKIKKRKEEIKQQKEEIKQEIRQQKEEIQHNHYFLIIFMTVCFCILAIFLYRSTN